MYTYTGIFTNDQCKYDKNTLYILHFHITIVFPTIALIKFNSCILDVSQNMHKI